AGGEAASAEHPGVRSRLQGGRDHLAYEPALPDAGDPDDGDEARPAAGRGLVDKTEHGTALLLASHHRRLALRPPPVPPPSPRPPHGAPGPRRPQAPAPPRRQRPRPNQRRGAGAAEP